MNDKQIKEMDGETFYNNLTDEQKAKAEEMGISKEKLINSLDELIGAINRIISVLKRMAEGAKIFADNIIKSYPNKQVVYLAYHGKKRRTRKKNINRIKKYIFGRNDGTHNH